MELLNRICSKMVGHILHDDHPAALLSRFSAPHVENNRREMAAYATLAAAKVFRKNYNVNSDLARQAHTQKVSLRRTSLESLCPPREPPICMPASERYRTHDGTCNNKRRQRWGASQMPFSRFLPPEYGDGVDTVRKSVDGGTLSSSRFVSLLVHGARDGEAALTLMLAQWGQLLDHDLTSTAQPRSINGSVPSCCGNKDFHPSCFPIKVPLDDPWLSSLKVRCLEFLRSAPAQRRDCVLSWREQTNQATSYIDASPIYSNSVKSSDSARVFRNGLLIFGRGNPNDDVCQRGAIATNCIRSGDGRSGEQPGLLALHHVWVGEHNHIATRLSEMNQHWSDEKIYQETRRIIGAMFQHITYREFLPIVLGKEVVRLFELELLTSGYYEGYDSKTNPGVANAFAAAAFRFGHSLVQNSYIRCDRFHNVLSNNVSLHEEFQRGDIGSVGSLHRLIRGMANQRALQRDEFITPELTNHLFQTPGFPFGLDLAAINIQRGRDHGIPPYTHWRVPCGLSAINTWEEFSKVVGPESARRISHAYQNVHDIDLFVGGIAERPVVGGLVGPTFACIIAQQFSNSRKGDRFWYENAGFESSFTPAQLHSIRKVTLASVLCRSVGGGTFQPHIFLPPDGPLNQRLPCGVGPLAEFDLDPWLEQDPFANPQPVSVQQHTVSPIRVQTIRPPTESPRPPLVPAALPQPPLPPPERPPNLPPMPHPPPTIEPPVLDRIFEIVQSEIDANAPIPDEFLNRRPPPTREPIFIPSFSVASGINRFKNNSKINDKLDLKRKGSTGHVTKQKPVPGVNNKLDKNSRKGSHRHGVLQSTTRRTIVVNNIPIELRHASSGGSTEGGSTTPKHKDSKLESRIEDAVDLVTEVPILEENGSNDTLGGIVSSAEISESRTEDQKLNNAENPITEVLLQLGLRGDGSQPEDAINIGHHDALTRNLQDAINIGHHDALTRNLQDSEMSNIQLRLEGQTNDVDKGTTNEPRNNESLSSEIIKDLDEGNINNETDNHNMLLGKQGNTQEVTTMTTQRDFDGNKSGIETIDSTISFSKDNEVEVTESITKPVKDELLLNKYTEEHREKFPTTESFLKTTKDYLEMNRSTEDFREKFSSTTDKSKLIEPQISDEAIGIDVSTKVTANTLFSNDSDIDPLANSLPLDHRRVQRKLVLPTTIKPQSELLNLTLLREALKPNLSIPLQEKSLTTKLPKPIKASVQNLELRQYQKRPSHSKQPHKVIVDASNGNGQYEIEINIRQTNKSPIPLESTSDYSTNYKSKPYEQYTNSYANYPSTTPLYAYLQHAPGQPSQPLTHNQRTKPPTIIFINEHEEYGSTTRHPGFVHSIVGWNSGNSRPLTSDSSFAERPGYDSVLSRPLSSNILPTNFQNLRPAAVSSFSQTQLNGGVAQAASQAVSNGQYGSITGFASANGADSTFSFNIRPKPDLTNINRPDGIGTYGLIPQVPPKNWYNKGKPDYGDQNPTYEVPYREGAHTPFSTSHTYYMRKKHRPQLKNGAYYNSEPEVRDFDYVSRTLTTTQNISALEEFEDVLDEDYTYDDDEEEIGNSPLIRKFNKDGYLRPELMTGTLNETLDFEQTTTVATSEKLDDNYVLPAMNSTKEIPKDSRRDNIQALSVNYPDSQGKQLNNNIFAEELQGHETPFDEDEGNSFEEDDEVKAQLEVQQKKINILKRHQEQIAFAPINILTKPERPDNWVIYDSPEEEEPLLPQLPDLNQDLSPSAEIPKPMRENIWLSLANFKRKLPFENNELPSIVNDTVITPISNTNNNVTDSTLIDIDVNTSTELDTKVESTESPELQTFTDSRDFMESEFTTSRNDATANSD
ncbi:uncharacterized protein LOC142224610 isoform X2 [Haematobia irritans]|uniref:uncharacterized protein LOC142224610 isoform X2 n=1 Tax=Haematobia irritans TaxID=7368 RepID=UPI003F50C09F